MVERAVVDIAINVGLGVLNVAVAHRSMIVTTNVLESKFTAKPLLVLVMEALYTRL